MMIVSLTENCNDSGRINVSPGFGEDVDMAYSINASMSTAQAPLDSLGSPTAVNHSHHPVRFFNFLTGLAIQ